MSFGLKNVRATYRRLMDKVFWAQISINFEAYVDDMVVKSENIVLHVKDLMEIFSHLRKTQHTPKPEEMCIHSHPYYQHFLDRTNDVVRLSKMEWKGYDIAKDKDGHDEQEKLWCIIHMYVTWVFMYSFQRRKYIFILGK